MSFGRLGRSHCQSGRDFGAGPFGKRSSRAAGRMDYKVIFKDTSLAVLERIVRSSSPCPHLPSDLRPPGRQSQSATRSTGSGINSALLSVVPWSVGTKPSARRRWRHAGRVRSPGSGACGLVVLWSCGPVVPFRVFRVLRGFQACCSPVVLSSHANLLANQLLAGYYRALLRLRSDSERETDVSF